MIAYTNHGTTTIISEVEPKHQCRLLQLIGDSLKKSEVIQYEFTEALKAFTELSPADKNKEIHAWINVMEKILKGDKNGKHKENKKISI